MKSWMHSLAQKRLFYEPNRCDSEVSIAAITHVSVGSMMWLQMAMAVTEAAKANQKTEWMTGVGAGLKGEMAEKKP